MGGDWALGHLGAQFSVLAVAQVVTSLALVALNLYLASSLGPSGFAAYGLFTAIGAVMALPVTWFSSAVVVFGQEDVARHGSSARSVGALATVGVAAAGLVLLAFAVGNGALTRIFAPVEGLTGLLAAYSLMVGVTSLVGGSLQASRAMRTYAAFGTVAALLSLAGVILGSALIGVSVTVAAVAVILGPALASIGVGLPRLRFASPPLFDTALIARVARFALSYVSGSVLAYVVAYFDVVLLALVLTTSALGEYAFAARIYQQLVVFAQLASTVVFPFMNTLRATGQGELVRDYVERRIPQLAAAACLVAAPLALVAVIATHLFSGGAYARAGIPLIILVVALFVAWWRRLISPVIMAYELLWVANAAALASAVVFLAGMATLAVRFSGPGAALTVALAAATDTLVGIIGVSGRIGARPGWTPVLLLGAGSVVIATPALLWPNASLAIVSLVALTAAYALLVRVLAIYGPRDLEDLAASGLPAGLTRPLRSAIALVAAPGPRA